MSYGPIIRISDTNGDKHITLYTPFNLDASGQRSMLENGNGYNNNPFKYAALYKLCAATLIPHSSFLIPYS